MYYWLGKNYSFAHLHYLKLNESFCHKHHFLIRHILGAWCSIPDKDFMVGGKVFVRLSALVDINFETLTKWGALTYCLYSLYANIERLGGGGGGGSTFRVKAIKWFIVDYRLGLCQAAINDSNLMEKFYLYISIVQRNQTLNSRTNIWKCPL